MKKVILYVILFDLILFWLVNLFTMKSFELNQSDIIADVNLNDNYRKEYEYSFVEETDKNIILNKQDILNVIYTILNNGYDNYLVSCSSKYANCVKDMNSIFNNKYALLVINNLVSPYNSYDKINVNYLGNDKFNISVSRIYSDEEITRINKKIDVITRSIIKDDMSDEDKIKVIHDYIINNSAYDIDNNEKSKSASGVLFNELATCRGYSDTLALFLDKLGIMNYRIVSNSHVWNMVYVNNNWYHVDVTYDAPLIGYKESILRYDYYLLSSEQLKELNDKNHLYNLYYYSN